MSTETPTTKVVTGTVRLSYLHVWEPATAPGSTEAKYSASLIIPKSDKATVEKVKAAIEAAKELGKAKWGGKIPGRLKMPLRDGDEERSEDEAYKGAYFLNANAKQKPNVVDRNLNDILEQSELYSGCYGRASITFYPFDSSGNKGIACGLNNIQKLKDGTPLSGRSTAEEDFGKAPLPDDDDDLS